ncbi:MAG: hypothetical protein PHY47_13185 [Lachnospiraceae bacterium]|nr:hypothetical protein [Lachnospiraceae bacterium]
MIKKFIYCGTLGWCLEIIFTACDSFRRRELQLKGNTSIWMFPIYGMAAFLMPLFKILKDKSVALRGTIYMITIFIVEYLSGNFLKKKGVCPWDYSRAKHNINGVIRVDYAIWWFLTGLLFEKVLKNK